MDSRMDQIQPIPSGIVKAICTIKSTIEAVAKTQFNKQGGYKFASADDIYAAITRKMGEVGLMILPLEMDPVVIERVEKEVTDDRSGAKTMKVSQWGKFRFGFVLACEDATWFDPRSSRTLFIQILGPQTFNAAESYCQKQYLRGLFKLPTGDMDLDSMPQAEAEDDQVALNKIRKPKSSSAAKKDGTTEVFNQIIAHINNALSAEHLQQVPEVYAEEIGTLPERWHQMYEDAYEVKMASFA